MSAFFYDHRKAMPNVAFDAATRSSTKMQRDASSDSFMCRGESTIDDPMVANNGLPVMERPDEDSPFSQWETYIVKQAHKIDHTTAMPKTPKLPFAALSPPRITWSDQIKRATPQAKGLAYTKSRDRVARPSSPQASPLMRPLDLLRSASLDLTRSRSPSSPPSMTRPLISSPYLSSSSSIPLSAQNSPSVLYSPPSHELAPLSVHAPKAVRATSAAIPEESLSAPLIGTPQSESPSLPSLSFSPFSSDSSSGCFSSIDRRASNTSTSSGRAPGPSELASYPIAAVPGSQSTAPPSIASSYSVHSRRSSWASSTDLDPAVVSSPPLAHPGKDWQEQQSSFLAEFGINHDSEESDAEVAPVHSQASDSPVAAQPIFQRMQADLVDDADMQYSNSSSGESLPPLDLSSLPREKDEARKVRSKMVSPLSLTKSFRKKSTKSTSVSADKNIDSQLRRGSASSYESDKRTSSELPSSTLSSELPPQLETPTPGSPLRSEWQQSITIPSEPTTPLVSTVALPPLEPREETPSILSSSSHSSGRAKTAAKRVRSDSAAGAAPTLDPLLARASSRLRSASIMSNESNGSNSRRSGRRSARNRITDGMPAFGNLINNVANTNTVTHLSVAAGGRSTLLEQRRSSNRSLASDTSSIDDQSNTSSFSKVAGSDDSHVPTRPIVAPKGVLRKRQASEDSHLASNKKEVSFELPPSDNSVRFDGIEPVSEEDELEHEQKQREMLNLRPMKLQSDDTNGPASAPPTNRDDVEITSYLATFGKDLDGVCSSQLLETFAGATSHEWPRRKDWDSLPAYMMAYATAAVSAYNDDGAALAYTAPKSQRLGAADRVDSSPLLRSAMLFLHDAIGWERPLVSAFAAAVYLFSLQRASVLPLILAGSASFFVGQGLRGPLSGKDDAHKRLATTLLGSPETRQRVKNLMLSRAPRATVRCTLTFVALVLSTLLSLSGLVGLSVGLVLFAWIPILLQQPDWAPTALKDTTPLDALLYDVPTDAQYAIMLMRKRACNGDQIVHTASPTTDTPISPAIFENKLSYEDLKTTSNVLDSVYTATYEGHQGHLFVLPTRVLFRTSMSANFADQLVSSHASMGGRVLFEARLDRLTLLTKPAGAQQGLLLGLKNGTRYILEGVEKRDLVFNKVLAIAPQKWVATETVM